MRALFHILLLLALSISVSAQPMASGSNPAGGNVYAIVVGIANYLEPGIPPLQFANRDAQLFAEFLQSGSGGSVPPENIRLLTDSSATTAAVYNAIYWLKNTCRENDLVYFYFSGHGDLENVTMYNNGYLICYNSPAENYINMALSIEHLNDITNTLSVKTKANVVLITDACHSGKLAGSKYRGNQLVGEQLMAVQQKEIRIASCKVDQLSNEKIDWGGGRGVFSYYLINGLKGLADNGNDGVVSLGEIKNYLETAMAADPVLRNENIVQTPVLKGNNDFKLATVVISEMNEARDAVVTDSISNAMVFNSSLSANDDIISDPEEYFLSELDKMNLAYLTERLQLDQLTPEEIPFKIINELKENISTEAATNKLAELENNLRSNKETRKYFNSRLGVAFDNKGQEIIHQYLSADEAELERRRYYNIESSGYDVYPKMFAVALLLTQPDNFFYNIIKVKLHYFTGVSLRLKIPLAEDPEELINQSFAEQQKALAMEENAAYIYNELGILYNYKNNIAEAEKNFIKATKYAPEWSVPQANLCGLYGSTGNYEKGIRACFIADSLKAGLQITNANLGLVYEKAGNLLFAEEYYRKAIDINSRHFYPFERLGFTYMSTTEYAEADSFYYESSLRKMGYHFRGNAWIAVAAGINLSHFDKMRCDVDSLKLKKNDVLAFFTWGVQEYEKKHYSNAVRILKKVIALDKRNPLVFHYMGKIFYDQQKWEDAELMFNYANQYYMDTNRINRYIDSVSSSASFPYDHSCYENFFRSRRYTEIENYYFIGTLYESWQHVAEAEVMYKKIIEFWPEHKGGYIKLWRLLETLDRNTEAESVIKKIAAYHKEFSDVELNAFYKRVLAKYPDNGEWNYRLGLLLYSRAKAGSGVEVLDSIIWFPKINKEVFINEETYSSLGNNPDLELSYISANNKSNDFSLETIYGYKPPLKLPGIDEDISLNKDIKLPRYEGIYFLKKAAELLSEEAILADINYKIGDIFVWAGSKKQAFPYYAKSIELAPGNANTRLNLVDVSKAIYKNRSALEQLNYLYDSNQINFQKRMLLAEFNIHAGQYDKATLLLNEAETIHPYTLPEIADLRGRLQFLSGNYKAAIPIYANYLSLQANDPQAAYSLARLYAKTGNTKNAWTWLEEALDHGFNFGFVLEKDPFLDELRKTGKWQTLMNKYSMKKYNAVHSNN